jgi:hypothetical protein
MRRHSVHVDQRSVRVPDHPVLGTELYRRHPDQRGFLYERLVPFADHHPMHSVRVRFDRVQDELRHRHGLHLR